MNVANLFQQFVEIIRTAIRVFQAVFVEDKAFLQVFFQCIVCPLAELCATWGANAETNGKNDIKTIV